MSVTANIRMYNQKDLGDCFLLKFTDANNKVAYYLIDFGSYTGANRAREREIAEHIKTTIGDNKLTIIVTHQHKDHLSGFVTAGDLLKSETAARELWLSYLDDENSTEGQIIRSATEKYWKKTKKINSLLEQKFADAEVVTNMLEQKKVFDLFAEDQTMGKAITNLLEIAQNNITFLTPGQNFPLPGVTEGVNVYVLGPPSSNELLTKMDPTKAEGVEGLNAAMEMANLDISGALMLDALENMLGGDESRADAVSRETDFPFSYNFIDNNPNSCTREEYYKDEERQIDHEWLSEIGRMALHMDKFTNNTSLVLAFEMIESKKVLLFVGDAQIGNWLSWSNIKFIDSAVTSKDLLSRTVLYKAGHHSSHNATLKQGLDLMNEKELIIMIPVEKKAAKPFKMLKPGMLTGYNRKSHGRVLRSDTIEQDAADLAPQFPFIARTDLPNLTIIPDGAGEHLAMELEIKG
jgi:glyoxylase-like metal-dependent hydrolase (beta-lactamase superfamily II)